MARNIDAALSLFADGLSSRSKSGAFAQLREFDQHGKIHAGHNFHLAFVQERRSDIRRSTAKHIGQNKNALWAFNALQRFFDHPGSRPNVVMPAERNGGYLV